MLRTSIAYVAMRVLDTPFWGLFNLLPFILYKDLQATPFQLGMIITLKPLVSILSSYWSTSVSQVSGRFVSSILLGRCMAFLPFLAFPFIHNAWYAILCSALFMFLQVGMMPAWMELLNQNVPKKTREAVFSYTQAFGYLGGGLLPFALGWVLDEWVGAWRWMFVATACFSLGAHVMIRWIAINPTVCLDSPSVKDTHPIFQPWKNAWELLRRRPDFARFQVGFMLIGSGLMIIQPALPVFFIDRLHLSYTEMGVAVTLCKGIGFACGSPFWVKWIGQVNLFYFGSVIAAIAALFPLLLFGAEIQMIWLYLAYLSYGIMQSGNELSWNLSGPLFAKKEDSSLYSSVNVIAVGIRGVFVPMMGAFCLAQFGSTMVVAMSGILCLLACLRMASYSFTTAKHSDQKL